MEPHREEDQKTLEPSASPKPKRFRIVKLEERIAPGHGATDKHYGCTGPCSPTIAEGCSLHY